MLEAMKTIRLAFPCQRLARQVFEGGSRRHPEFQGAHRHPVPPAQGGDRLVPVDLTGDGDPVAVRPRPFGQLSQRESVAACNFGSGTNATRTSAQ